LLGANHRNHPDRRSNFLDCNQGYQGLYYDPGRNAFYWGPLVCILDGEIDHHRTLEMVIALIPAAAWQFA